MASFKDFNVTELALQNTKKIPVVMPNGADTGEWVEVCSTLHPNFRKAQVDLQRKRREAMFSGKKDLPEMETEEYVATMVVGWSFEEECNRENIIAFLKAMPNTADTISIEAADQENFFQKEEAN